MFFKWQDLIHNYDSPFVWQCPVVLWLEQNIFAQYAEMTWKGHWGHSGLSKVIRFARISNGFLLVIHNNYGDILYRAISDSCRDMGQASLFFTHYVH